MRSAQNVLTSFKKPIQAEEKPVREYQHHAYTNHARRNDLKTR